MDIETFSARIIKVFRALENAFRWADPISLSHIREELLKHEAPLRWSLDAFPRTSEEGFLHSRSILAADLTLGAIELYGLGDDLNQSFMNVLRAHRKFNRAQEALFALRNDLEQVDLYFLEPGAKQSSSGRGKKADQGGLAGVFHMGAEDNAYARGGYSLYVPETYSSQRPWPLVVALHGGYSHGRDFLWTWVREARTRGFILLSPTSVDRTWSILKIQQDAKPVMEHMKKIQSRYRIDPSHILVTGMSDGATFALGMSLQEASPFTAVAPVSGVLAAQDLSHAKGKRIYWVHGALDWMFPVARAVHACRLLKDAGAEVELKVIQDLSHAYPREENGGILSWFAPDLEHPV